jgi:3-hydroxyacyl-[acyl-carrier-protein] dehydratase
MELTSNQIQEIIPHRYPFLLIDRIIDLEPGHSAKAIKNVTANEPFFTGHFPQEHVMPGVLLVEALAQAGAVTILTLDEYKNSIAYFAGIDQCKFKQKVIPGDQVILESTVIRRKGRLGVAKGLATVNGKLVCEAVLKFAIG